VLEFSDAELQACCKAYDPKVHEAPIVIGHPSQDAPAYGWVQSIAFADGRMNASADQLDPAFAEAVSAGRYKKVSASFYRPEAPTNPVPGVWYLRHVGFLGAAPPAVKGLRQVEFSDTAEDSVTVEFGDYADRNVASVLRSLRDWLLAKFGQEEADKALPAWNINTVQEEAAQPEPGSLPAGFSEGNEKAESSTTGVAPGVESPESNQSTTQPPAATTATAPEQSASPTPDPCEVELQEQREELEKQRVELERQKAELAAREAKAKLEGHVAYLEQLVKDGRPLPCHRDLVVSFMRLLDGETLDAVSFGETETRGPLELFKTELLSNLPKSVNFRELAPAGDELPTSDPSVIAAAAVTFQEEQRTKGVFVSTSEAVAHVQGVR